MIGLLCFGLAILTSPFRSKSRLEAENAVLRHQLIVLKTAADEARSVAREELRKLAPNYPTARPGKITSWCRDEASNFVRAFIEQHDRHHATLLQELERARR